MCRHVMLSCETHLLLDADIELFHSARSNSKTSTLQIRWKHNFLRHAGRVPQDMPTYSGKKKGGMMTAALGLLRISGGR